MKRDPGVIIGNIERLRNMEMSQDEQDEIVLWLKGRELAQIASLEGFNVIMEMLENYALDSLKKLAVTDPSKREEILAEQAVAFASQRIVNLLKEDVQSAIVASNRTPDSIREIKDTPAPPEIAVAG